LNSWIGGPSSAKTGSATTTVIRSVVDGGNGSSLRNAAAARASFEPSVASMIRMT